MTDQPNNTITLNTSTEEIIRIDKEGFHYRGQFIADAGEAHRLMVEFLRQNTKPEPQGPTLDDIVELCAEHEFILGIDGANAEGIKMFYVSTHDTPYEAHLAAIAHRLEHHWNP